MPRVVLAPGGQQCHRFQELPCHLPRHNCASLRQHCSALLRRKQPPPFPFIYCPQTSSRTPSACGCSERGGNFTYGHPYPCTPPGYITLPITGNRCIFLFPEGKASSSVKIPVQFLFTKEDSKNLVFFYYLFNLFLCQYCMGLMCTHPLTGSLGSRKPAPEG